MGTGWKTYLGVAILALSLIGKVFGAELPNVDNSTDLGVILGNLIAFLGLRDKLGKL